MACSKTFVRTIAYTNKDGAAVKKRILAIGNVACHPSSRGNGYGKAVVLAGLVSACGCADRLLAAVCTSLRATPPCYPPLFGGNAGCAAHVLVLINAIIISVCPRARPPTPGRCYLFNL